jgi:hypothetical protein
MRNRKLWLASTDGALRSAPLQHKNPAAACAGQVTQYATPKESVRLIRAFARVPDPFVRKLLTKIAEKYARE